MLPKLISQYRAEGYQFITLEEAERDPYYREDVDPSLPPRSGTLEQQFNAKHLDPSSIRAFVEPNFENVCR